LNDQLDDLLSEKVSKRNAIKLLSPFINQWGHTIIFTDYVNLAEEIHFLLKDQDVANVLLDSRVRRSLRTEAFEKFEEGILRSLVSPRVLDEGIDLPLLSFGIFAGVRRRRLQIIQRLGRVIRKDHRKTWPLVCVPVSIGTLEDPFLEGNEELKHTPLSILKLNALDTFIVDAADEDGINRVLNIYNEN
jgi:RNA polymerase primary sigma factor